MYCSKHRLSSTFPFCLKCLVESGQVTYPNTGTYFYIEMGQTYGQIPKISIKEFNKSIDRAVSIEEIISA